MLFVADRAAAKHAHGVAGWRDFPAHVFDVEWAEIGELQGVVARRAGQGGVLVHRALDGEGRIRGGEQIPAAQRQAGAAIGKAGLINRNAVLNQRMVDGNGR